MFFKTVLKMYLQRQENTRTQGTVMLQINCKKALVVLHNGLLVPLLNTINSQSSKSSSARLPQIYETVLTQNFVHQHPQRPDSPRARRRKYKYLSWVDATQDLQQNMIKMKNEVLRDAAPQMDLEVLCSVKTSVRKAQKPYNFIPTKCPRDTNTVQKINGCLCMAGRGREQETR